MKETLWLQGCENPAGISLPLQQKQQQQEQI
jgi:hypothetical protein